MRKRKGLPEDGGVTVGVLQGRIKCMSGRIRRGRGANKDPEVKGVAGNKVKKSWVT